LEPFASDFRIRCRIDGVLEEVPPPPRAWARAMTSRIKVLAGMDIAERRLPQDGRLCVRRAGRDVDLRVSTLPTQSGESVVLRVLDRAAVRLSLDEVGLPDSVRTEVRQRIRQPHGIFIVTGPTGSGKTTTLYSCLQEINAPDAKLLTVEDPVEYAIDGVTQVGVNVPAGLEFAAAMRAFLRQDPDVIMVGEMRDSETAATAVQAALTGHLVLSTLHTNDAPGALTRLVDMGIEPFLVAATVEGILAQRLVRRICPACRAPVAVSPKVQATPPQAGEDTGEIAWFAGRGCPDCAQTGYRGRRALFEWLPVSETLREQLMAGRSLQALRAQAVREGMRTLRQAALELARAGETTREEVLRHT
jgi:type IV pilus assembly protein PilB